VLPRDIVTWQLHKISKPLSIEKQLGLRSCQERVVKSYHSSVEISLGATIFSSEKLPRRTVQPKKRDIFKNFRKLSKFAQLPICPHLSGVGG
jgi:hypothetical protein